MSSMRRRELAQTTRMSKVRKLEHIQAIRDQLDTMSISASTRKIAIAILDSKTLEMDEFNANTLIKTAEAAKRTIDNELSASALADEIAENLRLFNLELDLKEKQAEIEELNRQLEVKSELCRLAGDVSHDVNNCLTVINGNLELLKTSDEPSKQELFDDIDIATKRSEVLLKRILEFSKGINFNRFKTNVSELIKSATRQSGKFQKVKVETDIHDGLVSKIDPVSITSALENLLVNAEQSVENNGLIRVTAEKIKLTEVTDSQPLNTNQNEFILITIEDNGVGIPKTLIKKIFEPFFTTKESNQGTGLGLSIVKRTLDLHGGYVTVSSQTGKGSFTKFKIYLPVT